MKVPLKHRNFHLASCSTSTSCLPRLSSSRTLRPLTACQSTAFRSGSRKHIAQLQLASPLSVYRVPTLMLLKIWVLSGCVSSSYSSLGGSPILDCMLTCSEGHYGYQ